MRIDRVDMWHVALPAPMAFRPAWIPGFGMRENRFDLLRITTRSGVQGWAAAPAMGRERAGLGELLGPYLLGERADDIPNVRQRIREMGYLGFRAGWIEPACWDVMGKARAKPVWRILAEHAAAQGGPAVPQEAPTVRLYASTGEVKGGEERAEEVQARMAEGFLGVKLRVHDDDPQADLDQIRITRERVGEGVQLMVDANQGWRVAAIADAPTWDQDRARRFCAAAGELGFSWVEEPLAHDDYAGLASLRRHVRASSHPVPLAGGELNAQGTPEFRVLIDRGCWDILQPDAVFTGGISGTWEIIRLIQASEGVDYCPHTWTNGVGFAINLQLFAASGYAGSKLLEYPYDPPSWTLAPRDGILSQPWAHQRGTLRVPDTPGLGFEIAPTALARHGRKAFSCTRTRVAVQAVLDRGLGAARELGTIREARLLARDARLDAEEIQGRGPIQLALRDPDGLAG